MSINLNPKYWNLRTKRGIPYKRLEGSPKGSAEDDDHEIIEEIIIESDQLGNFVTESFNDLSSVYPGGSWGLFYPGRSFEDISWFPTRKIEFEPFPPGLPGLFNQTLNDPTYAQFMKLKITYGTGKTTDSKDDMLEKSGNATGEFLLVQTNSKMYWETTDHPAKGMNVPVTQILPGVEWSVKYKRIEWGRLWSSISLCRSLMGCVNSGEMPQFNFAPAETILFAGFSWTSRYSWRSNKPVSDMELKLLEKNFMVPNPDSPDNPGLPGVQVTHNMFLNPDGLKWQTLYRANGAKIYKMADLNSLFYVE